MNVVNTSNNTIQHQIFHEPKESEMFCSISLTASVASDLFVMCHSHADQAQLWGYHMIYHMGCIIEDSNLRWSCSTSGWGGGGIRQQKIGLSRALVANGTQLGKYYQLAIYILCKIIIIPVVLE